MRPRGSHLARCGRQRYCRDQCHVGRSRERLRGGGDQQNGQQLSPPEQQRRPDQFCGGQQIAAPEPVAQPPRRRVNYHCTAFPWWADRPAAPAKARLGAGAQRRAATVGGLLAALGNLVISQTLRGTSGGGGAGTIYWPERLTPGQDLTRQPNRDLHTAPFLSNGRCWRRRRSGAVGAGGDADQGRRFPRRRGVCPGSSSSPGRRCSIIPRVRGRLPALNRRRRGRFTIPTTINAAAADPDRPGVLGQHAIWHERTRGINAALEEMGTHMPLTCFNCQLLDQPHPSEHLAGGDAGTMIWANSICGAGSNFRSGSGGPRCRQHGMDAKVRHPPGFAAAARKFAKPAARSCAQMSKLPAPTATAKGGLRVAAG